MKPLFAKIGRFFWSWGFLKFILWTVTIIVLFYIEEDWRGARDWAATKAEWENKGETLDLGKFVPPPVPDEQNLAAIPAFKLEQVKDDKGKSYWDDVPWQKAARNFPASSFAPLSSWRHGEGPDMQQVHQLVSTKYSEAFKNSQVPGEPLAQMDELYPFVADLHAAAARPYCRLPFDDSASMPAARSMGLVTAQIQVSRILTIRALLELENHQPDLALEDLKINFRLSSAAGNDPSLVGSLVAAGAIAIGNAAIYDGLAEHLWSDVQLSEIQSELTKADLLSIYQFGMRSEAAVSVLDIDFFKNTRPDLSGWLGMSDAPKANLSASVMALSVRSSPLFPAGWWDQNKCQEVATTLKAVFLVDPKTHRAFTAKIKDFENEISHLDQRGDANAPWNFVFTLSSAYLPTQAPKFAQAQVSLDEIRIACGLERYRLAHGVYPESLDGLIPVYAMQLPHDVINGEPYHYRLQPEGSFLLYSVGGNEKDDGGKIVFQKNSTTLMEWSEGDWVWPTPRAAKP